MDKKPLTRFELIVLLAIGVLAVLILGLSLNTDGDARLIKIAAGIAAVVVLLCVVPEKVLSLPRFAGARSWLSKPASAQSGNLIANTVSGIWILFVTGLLLAGAFARPQPVRIVVLLGCFAAAIIAGRKLARKLGSQNLLPYAIASIPLIVVGGLVLLWNS